MLEKQINKIDPTGFTYNSIREVLVGRPSMRTSDAERISLLENVVISLCEKLKDHGIYTQNEINALKGEKKE